MHFHVLSVSSSFPVLEVIVHGVKCQAWTSDGGRDSSVGMGCSGMILCTCTWACVCVFSFVFKEKWNYVYVKALLCVRQVNANLASCGFGIFKKKVTHKSGVVTMCLWSVIRMRQSHTRRVRLTSFRTWRYVVFLPFAFILAGILHPMVHVCKFHQPPFDLLLAGDIQQYYSVPV